MSRALLLGFFFTSLFYFFVYDSGATLMAAIKSGQSEIAEKQAQIRILNQKVAAAQEYQRSVDKMGSALNQLLSYIPENLRMQDFMRTVSEEAKIAGLNIISVAEVPTDNSNRESVAFDELALSVEFEGSFSQQMVFLSNLTKKKQIFTIDHFEMQRNQNTSDSDLAVVNFKAVLRAYRYVKGKASS